jgi:hypothetical protein
MSDDAQLDKAMIVNWALAELGLAPGFSIDDATGLGRNVEIFWPRAVGHCFGLHDWTFCRQTFKLSRQAAEPVTGYRFGFDLPGDVIGRPQKVLFDPRNQHPVRDYRIEGQTLYTDEPAIWTVHKVAVDPAIWDVQWANAFALALAHYLAIPLTQDTDLAEGKYVIAFGSRSEGGTGGVFGRLIAQDRAAEPLGASQMAEETLTGGSAAGPWHGRW